MFSRAEGRSSYGLYVSRSLGLMWSSKTQALVPSSITASVQEIVRKHFLTLDKSGNKKERSYKREVSQTYGLEGRK